MKKIKMFQVDAFTDHVFSGNPAAVCLLDEFLPDEILQHIAAENNLAETAFVVPSGDDYHIRWFTPLTEVDLCGHATLASACVLFTYFCPDAKLLVFQSQKKGALTVARDNNRYLMDFPADPPQAAEWPEELIKAMKIRPESVFKGSSDYLFVYSSQRQVELVAPDFRRLAKAQARGIIITAKGDDEDVDFVSRFFAPQVGIDEDPVTGSAHTTLTPYWSEMLSKSKFQARQVSQRGGQLWCEIAGDRVMISGQARVFMAGEIYI